MTNSAADEKPDLMAPDDAAQRCLADQQRGRPATVGPSSAGRP
jgi:hypothetical protein